MAKTRTQSPKIPAAKVFDISTRRMAAFIDVPIMDPLNPDTETGMVVRMRSPKSAEMREAAAAWYANHAPDGTLQKNQWGEFILEMACAATESWSGVTNGGDPLSATPENIRALYEHAESAWIGEQVAAAYTDKSRFFVPMRSA